MITFTCCLEAILNLRFIIVDGSYWLWIGRLIEGGPFKIVIDQLRMASFRGLRYKSDILFLVILMGNFG